MASATRIVIRPEDTGLWRGRKKQDEATAAKVSDLLQEDLEKHHVFFNPSGFHNHLVHQLLTLYGTGASSSTIQAAYDANKTYQLSHIPLRSNVVSQLKEDWAAHANDYLGLGKHYSDFLKFFQDEIDARGWEAVVTEFLCEETPKARDMVQRLFSGLIHPMIELNFGLEWEQPAIIAEGLAQTAVHRNSLGEFYQKVDEAVLAGAQPTNACLSDICETIHTKHPDLANSVSWSDEYKLYDGVLGRGLSDAVDLCAQIRVREEDLEETIAQVLHHNAYAAASASFKPPYITKYDFFLIHGLNSSAFLLSFNKPCFPASAKIRIMEHKMRYDVVEYIARGAAPLSPLHIKNYTPHEDMVSAAEDLVPRFHKVIDDGHLVKVVRSLLLAQELSRKWIGRPWIRIDNDEDWLKAHYMLLRSVEGQETLWVRGSGFHQAWEGVDKATAPRL